MFVHVPFGKSTAMFIMLPNEQVDKKVDLVYTMFQIREGDK